MAGDGSVQRLADRARAGDPESVEALWRRLRPAAAAVLLSRTPPGWDLEDLLQEVATAFVSGLPGLREPERAVAWIRGIARHVAADAGRQHGRGARRLGRLVRLEEAPEPARGPGDGSGDPAGERARRVLEAARRLPTDYREPLLLRAVQGLSQADIARALGISEEAVEARLARARRTLRRLLEQEEGGGGSLPSLASSRKTAP